MSPDAQSLHLAIFSALCAALGLTAEEADIHLLRAWADQPPAEPPPSRNICYYWLQTDPSAPILQETSTSDSTAHADSMIPCRIVLVFYGPASEAWALRCRTFLFLDGADKPRSILRKAGLFLIPFPPAPTVLYEETGKARRKRADLVIAARLKDDSVHASVTDESETPIPVETVETPPKVKIHRSPK